ncbi:MAG: DNRLRE domain-containing protein [Calditrichia bacterium]|nr:DNRLRE domain-containing protein [Calditrichia bacterium]
MKRLNTVREKFILMNITILLISGLGICQSPIILYADRDNTLYEDSNGSLSNGSGSYFFTGKDNKEVVKRGLLYFDISLDIPAGSLIDSVFLILYMSNTKAGPEPVTIHRVLTDWGEGASDASGNEGAGDSSATDDATWIHRFYDSDLWIKPGGDFDSTLSTDQTVDTVGFYTWGSPEKMVGDMQDWLDNPDENFGWILIGNEDSTGSIKRFDSRENSTEANRPQLLVYYSNSTSISVDLDNSPTQYTLAQNFPNSFNPSTMIKYRLPITSEVELTIYNTLGQKVTTLVSEKQQAGYYEYNWDAGDMTSGVYYYQFRAGKFQNVKKMILVR